LGRETPKKISEVAESHCGESKEIPSMFPHNTGGGTYKGGEQLVEERGEER